MKTTFLSLQAEKILTECLSSEFGIQVLVHENGHGTVTPALRARQILYRFRQELPNPEFKTIMIKLCPKDPDHRLWIIKRSPEEEGE